MAIQNNERFAGQTSDGLVRTDWFDPSVQPTIAGPYECTTGSGHIFMRTWAGATWLSSINNAPTTVRMTWRGVVPGSIPVEQYPAAKRDELRLSLGATNVIDIRSALAS